MKFRIEGVDASTGADRIVVIDVENELTAIVIAKDRGILPYKVQEVSTCSQVEPRDASGLNTRKAQDNAVLAIISAGIVLSVFSLVCIVGWVWLTNNSGPTERDTSRTASTSQLKDIPAFNASDRQELKDIDQELHRRELSSDPTDRDLGDIHERLEPLKEKARARIATINLYESQPGYPLEARREAAYQTFVDQGYSPDEARRTVQAMEEKGLLPDPPRQ